MKKKFIFIILVGSVMLAMFTSFHWKKRDDYPGSGTYNLTEYDAYRIEGKGDIDEIQVIDMDFKTNTTKIKVANEGDDDVIIYLYKNGNIAENDYIASFDLKAQGKKKFTLLSAASKYQIGVATEGEQYSLKIAD